MQSHDDSHIEIAQFVLECNSFIPDHASCISRPSSVIRNRDRNSCSRLGTRGSRLVSKLRTSRFGVRGSGFAVRGSGFAVRGSRLGARGSRLGARARGSRLGVFRSANDFRLPPPDSPIHPFTHSPIHRPTQRRGKRGCRRSGPVPLARCAGAASRSREDHCHSPLMAAGGRRWPSARAATTSCPRWCDSWDRA